MEQHRDMYLSLDTTGKKLVSGLDTQEDATLLHRRLEEMNQRWSYLKAKSIAIRYVLLLFEKQMFLGPSWKLEALSTKICTL